METRVNIQQALPNAYKALLGLESYLATTVLTKTQKELIKIRASQLNGCAFCIDMHTKDALKYGETPQRIFLLNAWRETGKFSAEEKALLAITEEVSLIHQHGLTDATYENAKNYFSEEVIAQIIIAVVTINAWNRIAVSTQLPVVE
ncbi:carboxymuconolactone decarboxylase family protein [Flavobacterium azooxidireducens]|uniref:Carboxymuconolactone decarboxylase family protein n=1 Tax=Flavobacterium azooxidireducens TaxID=1871076 RepID=A0ABY4KDX9_9FLAO|nr:carboxymuconolactone decarboxylase family protein [Flavobacterium azooxidireducens]UPQ77998.1 carboxymuconolactone decarboxylase family protein [Flavobacterium azooxidireducens]